MKSKGSDNDKCCPLGPTPKASSLAISKVMRANISHGTGPELLIRKTLREIGLSGYRLNWKGAPGRPDIAFPSKKVAVFVHGCFWHRCPYCRPSLPKTHTTFWKCKFERNVERDRKKTKALKKQGWKVFVFWECQVKKDPRRLALKVKGCVR